MSSGVCVRARVLVSDLAREEDGKTVTDEKSLVDDKWAFTTPTQYQGSFLEGRKEGDYQCWKG